MLLFILSLYLHCDLFHCDDTVNAKFNESSLMDKHHQNLLQVNTFLKTLKENPADLNPYPQYDPSDRRPGLLHWLPPVFPDFKLPLPPLVMPRPSTPYPMPVFPFKNPGQIPGTAYPGFLLRPMNSMYPSRPSRFYSDYRYQNIYLKPPGPYFQSLSYIPGPNKTKNLPFLYEINLYLQKNPRLLNPLYHPSISPPISDPAVSSKTPPPVTTPSSTIWTTTIHDNAKLWLHVISPYMLINKTFKNPLKDPTPPHRSVKTTAAVTNAMPKINDSWFATGTAKTGQFFKEDEHGFLYLSLPEITGTPVQTKGPDKEWMTSTAGDVLHEETTVSSPSPKQRYLDLMEKLNEGYLMVFMIELSRMIAVKDKQGVQDVLRHTETIYNSLRKNGRLTWIGDPLETVICKLTKTMSGNDIDLVRTDASILFHTLLERKSKLSAEVNSIIDKAGQFYNHGEGKRLLYAVKQFEDYPNTTKNGYWLCASLIESFILPFRRLSGSDHRQRLVDSVNKALKQRFPHLSKERNEGTPADQESQKNESKPRKRKKKPQHTRKRKRKRRHHITDFDNKNIYATRRSQDIDYKRSILKTMTPVTSEESESRDATSIAYRANQRQPTTEYFNQVGRSPRKRKPSYEKTTQFQEKLDTFARKNYKIIQQTVRHHNFNRKLSTIGLKPPPSGATSTGPIVLVSNGFHSHGRSKRSRNDEKSFYQRMKDWLKETEAKNKDKRLKLKAELLIKITEGSSYSDEEESLTRNLNEALKYVNKTVDFGDETR